MATLWPYRPTGQVSGPSPALTRVHSRVLRFEQIKAFVLLVVGADLGVTAPEDEHVGDEHGSMANAWRGDLARGLYEGGAGVYLAGSGGTGARSTRRRVGRLGDELVGIDGVEVVLDALADETTENRARRWSWQPG